MKLFQGHIFPLCVEKKPWEKQRLDSETEDRETFHEQKY